MGERIDRKHYIGYLSGVADGLNQGRQDTIAELEKIKAEILNYIIKPNTDEEEAIMQIINNRISELKGE